MFVRRHWINSILKSTLNSFPFSGSEVEDGRRHYRRERGQSQSEARTRKADEKDEIYGREAGAGWADDGQVVYNLSYCYHTAIILLS